MVLKGSGACFPEKYLKLICISIRSYILSAAILFFILFLLFLDSAILFLDCYFYPQLYYFIMFSLFFLKLI